MSTIAEIKEAIAKLSPREHCELMAELHPFEDDEWDERMKADFASDKMAWLVEETDAAIRAGRTAPLEDVLSEKS